LKTSSEQKVRDAGLRTWDRVGPLSPAARRLAGLNPLQHVSDLGLLLPGEPSPKVMPMGTLSAGLRVL
jgi:hypothetical protein